MTKRAVLYARVSGDDRQNATSSIDGQFDLGREYAKEKGYKIVAELAEDERRLTSGASWDLPQLKRILEMANANEFDVLVVRELDRLARSLAKQLVVEEQLKRAGVRIDYVLGEYAQTPEGQLSKQIRAVIAEYEREKIRERAIRGRIAKVKSGKVHVTGRPPYGYKESSEGILELDPVTSKIVKMIFDMYLEGKGSRQIINSLNKLKIPSPQAWLRPEAIWRHSTIFHILDNRTYIGEWYYGKNSSDDIYNDIPPVTVPAIIERSVFDAVQERKTQNKRLARRNRKCDYLLTGMIRCGACLCAAGGTRANKGGRRKRDYFYYYCYLHHEVRNGCPGVGFWQTEVVDFLAWEWVKSLLMSPQNLELGLQKLYAQMEEIDRPLRERLSIIESLITKNERELERLLDLYLSNDFPRELLVERKNSLEKALKDLKQEQATIIQNLESQRLNEEDIESLLSLTHEIAASIEHISSDIKQKRDILQKLNFKGTMTVIEGKRILEVQCILGKSFLIASNSTPLSHRQTQTPAFLYR